MRKKSLLYRLAFGLLAGILLMPPQTAYAQWTVYDPAQYTLQVSKKVEEANRWLQHYTNLVQQLTTLKGVLSQAEELVAKQRNAITTMSNIGRTIRASYQLKDQLEAIVISRMRVLKSINERLKNGIFDPEADFRDFEEYLKTSIGRSSQDSVANLERLMRMDNQLQRMYQELEKAREGHATAKRERMEARSEFEKENRKSESERCAPCIASLMEKMSNSDLLIAHYTSKIDELEHQIAERKKKYNIEMEERVKFGEQVQSMNKAWSQFNNSLDELQRTLRKVN